MISCAQGCLIERAFIDQELHKAKAIAHGADEIQGLLTFQVRRMTVALDEAAAGLLDPEVRAAS